MVYVPPSFPSSPPASYRSAQANRPSSTSGTPTVPAQVEVVSREAHSESITLTAPKKSKGEQQKSLQQRELMDQEGIKKTLSNQLVGGASNGISSKQRSHSCAMLSTQKLAPSVRRFDTLQHMLGTDNASNPGTVMIARNNPREWQRVKCAPNSMLQNVEVRPCKGLLNLTGSELFCTGALTQTQKRDLQRTVVSVILAYNELAKKHGLSPISLHENHLLGDGEVYEDRKIPRKPNERDYDYYHTLGTGFSENGKLLPHYHLEFECSLDKHTVGAILTSLHDAGGVVLGQKILTENDITNVLDCLPEAEGKAVIDAAMIKEKQQLLPDQLSSPNERSQRRDELESAFIALSSQNTELAAGRPFTRNAHMNSFRPGEAMFECFSSGHTSVLDDLLKIDNYRNTNGNSEIDVSDLLAIHHNLNKASKELFLYEGGTEEERSALKQRFDDATDKIKQLLSV